MCRGGKSYPIASYGKVKDPGFFSWNPTFARAWRGHRSLARKLAETKISGPAVGSSRTLLDGAGKPLIGCSGGRICLVFAGRLLMSGRTWRGLIAGLCAAMLAGCGGGETGGKASSADESGGL